jgi:hypothetical protein
LHYTLSHRVGDSTNIPVGSKSVDRAAERSCEARGAEWLQNIVDRALIECTNREVIERSDE